MAGGRSLALDTYAELSNEQPRLRHRMAFSSGAIAYEIGPVDSSAQLYPISAIARIGIQRLHTAGSEGQGGLELDVDIADGLQFPAAGRERGQ